MHNPMVGRVTSEYDLKRKHPVFGTIQPHRGIDLGAPIGTLPHDYIGADVRAAYAGVVEAVCTNWRSGWGAIWGRSGDGVFIRNPDGEGQYYGHLNSVDVKVGQKVTEGQVIGGMGVSGNVTGPHLHFEIHASTSGPRNNYTHTRNPRADFQAAGITPGQDPFILAGTGTTSNATPTGGLSMSDIKKIEDALANLPSRVLQQEITVQRSGKPKAITVRSALQNADSAQNSTYGIGLTNAREIAALKETVSQLAVGTGVAIDYDRIEAAADRIEEALAVGFQVEGTVQLSQKEK